MRTGVLPDSEVEPGRSQIPLATRVGRLLRRCWRILLDIVYPPSCVTCGSAIGEPAMLCARCWSRVRFIERPYCERLGTPFAHDLGQPLLSPAAIADPPVYARARAVACFDDGPVRDLVHRLKYGDRIELAQPMGRWMARAGKELLCDADLIVPVPLHRLRLMSRRFNQAAALAATLSTATGIAMDPIALRRVKATPPQVRLSRPQRAANVQGAFAVSPDDRCRVESRRIVLVDDVLTSGATLNAAARALLRAGARSVDALVFARVVTDG